LGLSVASAVLLVVAAVLLLCGLKVWRALFVKPKYKMYEREEKSERSTRGSIALDYSGEYIVLKSLTIFDSPQEDANRIGVLKKNSQITVSARARLCAGWGLSGEGDRWSSRSKGTGYYWRTMKAGFEAEKREWPRWLDRAIRRKIPPTLVWCVALMLHTPSLAPDFARRGGGGGRRTIRCGAPCRAAVLSKRFKPVPKKYVEELLPRRAPLRIQVRVMFHSPPKPVSLPTTGASPVLCVRRSVDSVNDDGE
jgi:hypothetical protein